MSFMLARGWERRGGTTGRECCLEKEGWDEILDLSSFFLSSASGRAPRGRLAGFCLQDWSKKDKGGDEGQLQGVGAWQPDWVAKGSGARSRA